MSVVLGNRLLQNKIDSIQHERDSLVANIGRKEAAAKILEDSIKNYEQQIVMINGRLQQVQAQLASANKNVQTATAYRNGLMQKLKNLQDHTNLKNDDALLQSLKDNFNK